jgi:hypothetical protein
LNYPGGRKTRGRREREESKGEGKIMINNSTDKEKK